jgi:alkylation response protein AidB-like acyl-CoA dehydrogenase
MADRVWCAAGAFVRTAGEARGSTPFPEGESMAWDFSTESEWQEQLDWIEQFCRTEIEPFVLAFPYAIWSRSHLPAGLKDHLDGLKQQVKDRGLWGIFLDKEIGGPGFGQLKLALVNEILGRYPAAPAIFGCQAPDTGNMDILAKFGTPEQKKKYLEPLFNQEMRSCYSMTEPQGGADTRNFQTHAERDGDEWVINGEKWFSSFGKTADIIIVMCNNGMFIVEQGTPGLEFLEGAGIHAHIRYNNVRVPLGNLLGPEGGAHAVAQFRLGGGRIHHAMRSVAQVKLALDMMCERAISRYSRGKLISEHQSVKHAIADAYMQVEMLRLLVLQTAWKIDNTDTRETRADIGACKIQAARVLKDVVYKAHHIHGALGTTDLTPLQGMWASAPQMSMMDGPDEVHLDVIANTLLGRYEPHEGLFPREYLPAKRRAAREQFQWLIDSDPEIKEHVEQMDRFAASRG